MFPGHPYLRQEMNRAEQQGEQGERDRVLRLIAQRKNQAHRKRQHHLDQHDMDKQVDEAIKIDVLNELERAVRQGWQR